MNNYQEKTSWEERSRLFGNSIQGVLFKNLPEILNRHVHDWHLHCIFSFLKGATPANLLDIGCGYGRLSLALRERFPGLHTVGLDISPHYVELYKKNLGQPAYQCSAEGVPADAGLFDCILVVTVFMYLQNGVGDALGNLLKHLPPDGNLIVIEKHCSGNFFLNPFGLRDLVAGRAANARPDTGGKCFRSRDFKEMVAAQGGRVVRELRMPVTTMFLIPGYALCKILPASVSQIILNVLTTADRLLGKLPLPTLHAAYLIKKVKT